MDRREALERIKILEGVDIRPLAAQFGITVWKGSKKNKGWAGHVIERHLGLALNSSRSPNFGSWELKVVPLKLSKGGILKVKETMAITMIDPVEVAAKEFEDSHLFNKLKKMVVVSRVFENVEETSSMLHAAAEFDLDNPVVYDLVKSDYEIIRQTILKSGFSSLSGSLGKLIQPRTKGAGHGSTSRAFYARAQFVAHILNIAAHPLLPPVVPSEDN